MKGFQDDVAEPLAGQYVTSDDRGLRGRVQQGVFRDIESDGGEATLIQGDVAAHQAAKRVNDGRVRD